jgi:hypothetical protein
VGGREENACHRVSFANIRDEKRAEVSHGIWRSTQVKKIPLVTRKENVPSVPNLDSINERNNSRTDSASCHESQVRFFISLATSAVAYQKRAGHYP